MKKISLNTKSLKINTIFNALYQILALLAPLLTTPYISRVFNPSILGNYNYYYSILGYFTLIAVFGFNDYGTKAIAQTRDKKADKSIAFWNIMITKGILSLFCLLVYFITFLSLFHDNKIAIYIFLTMTLYIISILLDPIFYFQGNENFVSISLRNTFMRIVTIVCIFIFVKSKNDIVLYSLILSTGNLLATLIMYFSFKRNEIEKPNLKKLHILSTFKYAFPFFIPSLAVTLFTSLNQTLLGILNSDASQGGYYAQALKIINILSTLAGSLSVIILSRMYYLFTKKDEVEILKKTEQTFEAFWIVGLPLLFGIIAVAKRLIPTFLGPGYDEAIPVLYISALVIILSPLNTLLGSIYFRPRNKIWIQTLIIIGSSILNIVLSYLLIPKYGARGAATGRLIAELIQLPLLIYFSKDKIPKSTIFKGFIKPFDSAIIMFIFVLLIDNYLDNKINSNILLIINIIIGIMTYGLFEIIFKERFVMQFIHIIIRKLNKRKYK